MPPFGLFLTEVYILTAGIASHPFAVVIALLLLALIFVGFLRFIAAMVFGKPAEPVARGEVNALTIVPPVVLLALIAGDQYLPAAAAEDMDQRCGGAHSLMDKTMAEDASHRTISAAEATVQRIRQSVRLRAAAGRYRCRRANSSITATVCR